MQNLTDQQWAAGMVADIPRPWAGRLLSAWEKRRAAFNPLVTTGEGIARRKANEQLRADVAMLRPVNEALPLDASDTDLCNVAWDMAERCRVKLLAIEAEQNALATSDFLDTVRAAGFAVSAGAIDAFEQRARLAALCNAGGIDAPENSRYEDLPAVRRMVAAHWWKGRLRKAHGKAKERAAINLGLVRRDRECYVSSVSVLDRQWQNERNAAALEATIAWNKDTDQEFTLAQLAAKGPANARIRRCELMTRINGFERIAIGAGHAGLFLTITCPSKMHRMKTRGARSMENGNWDGTTPDLSQKYLAKVWSKIRASLARGNKKEKRPPVSLYGFRIAEPQHDGTPHWHCLFFYEPEHDRHVRAVVSRYALEVDGDEPGAQEKRCDFKTMDPAKGTAAGYIAKYVAKNIDGYRLEKDLEGNDSLETSARVEAWATRWRIRQFQQIGGPPVTVWRELRRVENVPSDAPEFVIAAHRAVNKVATFEGRDNASVAWDHYVAAQGGVDCGRNYRVRIAKAQSDAIGRYGETGAPVIVGIEYFEVAKVRDALGNWTDILPRTVTVESKRFTWEIMRPASSVAARAGHAPRAVVGLDFGLKRAPRAPWTCVNNCTGSGDGRSETAGGGTQSGDRQAVKNGTGSRGEVHRGSIAAHSGSRSTLTR
jgi:hypothetical protein